MPRIGAAGSDLAELAAHLLKNGPRKVIDAPRRVRVIFNNTVIVDSTRGSYVWEHDGYPHYYFPLSEIKLCNFRDLTPVKSDGIHRASVVELKVVERPSDGIKEAKTDRVLKFTEDRSLGALAGLVRLEFSAMDQWLEEDVPIYVHPKDPYKRVDILPSTRPVEIRIGDKTVAKTEFSMHLHETGLPTRYYFSPGAVEPSLLRRSDLVTKCPYKGEAEYYHIVVDNEVHQNIVWYYRNPTHESAAIAGLLCFYNEKVDVVLDGQLLERPKTVFG